MTNGANLLNKFVSFWIVAIFELRARKGSIWTNVT